MKYIKAKDGVSIENVVGKTISSVESGLVEGEYGLEPTMYLLFTDGTWAGIVMPSDGGEAVYPITVKVRK